jgi:F0F1-type ATP synthase membrane subunit a
MIIFGIRLNNNILAVILALAVMVLCLTIAYLFQKHLFGKYRGKVKNVVNKGSPMNATNTDNDHN